MMDLPALKSPVTVAREIYSVSRLNREAKLLLEGSFPPLWVEGEISNLAQPSSGHLYFCLKDGQAQLRCAFFRGRHGLSCIPKNGMSVLARGRISLYEGRGEFQLLVDHLEEAGEGALRRAFEALKARLGQEGLFDIKHKKPLPTLPQRIGVITSPTGAAVRDIITTLRRRFPAIAVLLYPVPVQGEGAASIIASAIRLASERAECDALILARGGGSLEDLWSFNDEAVARALFACRIPVVCGIGHESDVTIADLVADVRAPTPTAAAEMLSPQQNEWLAQYSRQQARLINLMQRHLREVQQRVDGLSGRLLRPDQRLQRMRQQLQALFQRLQRAQSAGMKQAHALLQHRTWRLHACSPGPRLQALAWRCRHQHGKLLAAGRARLTAQHHRLQQAAQALNALSPLATLTRGYAIVQRPATGAIVRSARELKVGDALRARLAEGSVDCRVEQVRTSDAPEK